MLPPPKPLGRMGSGVRDYSHGLDSLKRPSNMQALFCLSILAFPLVTLVISCCKYGVHTSKNHTMFKAIKREWKQLQMLMTLPLKKHRLGLKGPAAFPLCPNGQQRVSLSILTTRRQQIHLSVHLHSGRW